MCLSPDEMSAEQLQNSIDLIKRRMDSPRVDESFKLLYSGRLEMFEKLLKEKADAGEMA